MDCLDEGIPALRSDTTPSSQREPRLNPDDRATVDSDPAGGSFAVRQASRELIDPNQSDDCDTFCHPAEKSFEGAERHNERLGRLLRIDAHRCALAIVKCPREAVKAFTVNISNAYVPNTLQVTRVVRQTHQRAKTRVSGCTSVKEFRGKFKRGRLLKCPLGQDLQIGHEESFKCAVSGCKKELKIWRRRDKFHEHVRRAHPDLNPDLLALESSIVESTEDDCLQKVPDIDTCGLRELTGGVLATDKSSDSQPADGIDNNPSNRNQGSDSGRSFLPGRTNGTSDRCRFGGGGNDGQQQRSQNEQLSVGATSSGFISGNSHGGFDCLFDNRPHPDKFPRHRGKRFRFVSRLKRYHEKHGLFYCGTCLSPFDDKQQLEDHGQDQCCAFRCVTIDCLNHGDVVEDACPRHGRTNSQSDIYEWLRSLAERIPDRAIAHFERAISHSHLSVSEETTGSTRSTSLLRTVTPDRHVRGSRSSLPMQTVTPDTSVSGGGTIDLFRILIDGLWNVMIHRRGQLSGTLQRRYNSLMRPTSAQVSNFNGPSQLDGSEAAHRELVEDLYAHQHGASGISLEDIRLLYVKTMGREPPDNNGATNPSTEPSTTEPAVGPANRNDTASRTDYHNQSSGSQRRGPYATGDDVVRDLRKESNQTGESTVHGHSINQAERSNPSQQNQLLHTTSQLPAETTQRPSQVMYQSIGAGIPNQNAAWGPTAITNANNFSNWPMDFNNMMLPQFDGFDSPIMPSQYWPAPSGSN